MSKKIKNADRLRVSGVDGRPKGAPVLEAIDEATWSYGYGVDLAAGGYNVSDMHNDVIRILRTVYLQHHPQGPEAPGDGGEFEKVLRVERSKTDNLYFHNAIGNLENAHNADRAADKRRITELEAENAKLKEMKLSVIMEYASDKDKLIAELEAQLAAVEVPRVDYEDARTPIQDALMATGLFIPDQCASIADEIMLYLNGYGLRFWDIESTPTLPETSDDMIAGDGDA